MQVSLPLGAGRSTIAFLRDDPPPREAVSALRAHARAEFTAVRERLFADRPTPTRVVGTSKTIRSLARLVGGPADPVEFRYSYFQKHPFAEAGLDYYGGEEYDAATNYSYQHTIGDIINASIAAGFEILRFDERPEHISNTWYNVEKQGPPLPMSFDLLLRKRDGI